MAEDDKKVPPLTERRENFARKQASQGKGVFAGMAPQGTGPINRHGMPQLPPGQRKVPNWPVLDLGDQPEISREEWRLELTGLVERPAVLTWDEFMALPQTSDESDFHCVTTWSRMDNHWVGVRFSDVAERVGVKPEARFALITAYDQDYNSSEHYTTNVALDEAMKPDVLLVHTWEGEPLPREHGGPVRMITPQLYAWKGAKWIHRIEFAREDRRGFWERRGYSNTAVPWFNDRYSGR